MFTLNTQDLERVANSKEIEKEATMLTEKKASQCAMYGFGAVVIALVIGYVLTKLFSVEVSDMLIGCSILPITAFTALRTAYIKTIYHDGLVAAATKKRQKTA